MVLFWLIAVGLTGFALYRFGELRGAWTRWRASVGVLRSRRKDAVGLFSGLALLMAVGALALFVVYVLFRHHLCRRYCGSKYRPVRRALCGRSTAQVNVRMTVGDRSSAGPSV